MGHGCSVAQHPQRLRLTQGLKEDLLHRALAAPVGTRSGFRNRAALPTTDIKATNPCSPNWLGEVSRCQRGRAAQTAARSSAVGFGAVENKRRGLRGAEPC